MSACPMEFACPACGQQLSAPTELEGARADCAACGAQLLIPSSVDTRWTGSQDVELLPLRFRHDRNAVETEMDMTPMVDVTFLLLIFFMVTATFTLQESFEMPTPTDDQASQRVVDRNELEDDPDVVSVRIDEFNTFFVSGAAWPDEQEAPSKQELMTVVRDAVEGENAPTRMMILAHPECRHEQVIVALDVGSAVRMRNVEVVTDDDERF